MGPMEGPRTPTRRAEAMAKRTWCLVGVALATGGLSGCHLFCDRYCDRERERCERTVEQHRRVEVGRLRRSAHRRRGEDARAAEDGAERLEASRRLAKVRQPIAEIGAEADEVPHTLTLTRG